MTNQEIERLVDKYIDGTATDSERSRLLEWYRENLEEDTIWLSNNPNERPQVKERMKAKMQLGIGKVEDKNSRVINIKRLLQAVAAVVILVATSLWLNYKLSSSHIQHHLYISHQASVDSTENRYVRLPDSSVVILRYGSSLEIVSDFSKNTREVRLTGEGYFDINRDQSRPFIVHVGEVRTVVLGTAFTIKGGQENSDVQVTVRRGKVRVEKRQKVIAELTANQQLEVDVKTEAVEQKEVRAEVASLWTSTDLQFDGKSFGELIHRLTRRYNTSITFDSPDLANCPITGKFTGTESLEEILIVLCSIRQANFTKLADGSIVITGKGC